MEEFQNKIVFYFFTRNKGLTEKFGKFVKNNPTLNLENLNDHHYETLQGYVENEFKYLLFFLKNKSNIKEFAEKIKENPEIVQKTILLPAMLHYCFNKNKEKFGKEFTNKLNALPRTTRNQTESSVTENCNRNNQFEIDLLSTTNNETEYSVIQNRNGNVKNDTGNRIITSNQTDNSILQNGNGKIRILIWSKFGRETKTFFKSTVENMLTFPQSLKSDFKELLEKDKSFDIELEDFLENQKILDRRKILKNLIKKKKIDETLVKKIAFGDHTIWLQRVAKSKSGQDKKIHELFEPNLLNKITTEIGRNFETIIKEFLYNWCRGKLHGSISDSSIIDSADARKFPMKYMDALNDKERKECQDKNKNFGAAPYTDELFPNVKFPAIRTQGSSNNEGGVKFQTKEYYPLGKEIQMFRIFDHLHAESDLEREDRDKEREENGWTIRMEHMQEKKNIELEWLTPKAINEILDKLSNPGDDRQNITHVKHLVKLTDREDEFKKRQFKWRYSYSNLREYGISQEEYALLKEYVRCIKMKGYVRYVNEYDLEQDLRPVYSKGSRPGAHRTLMDVFDAGNISEIHKGFRFLCQFEEFNLPYLKEECLKKAYKEIIERFGDEALTTRVDKFLSVMTSLTGDIERGLLLHGPPGTGKTTLTKFLADHSGFELLTEPFAGGDILGGIVGDAEKLITELTERGRYIPHLPVCLAVDEIDSLAPNRSDSSGSNKVDSISVLLARFGGIADVKNMFVFGSTNRMKSMDDAILSRLNGKFYVGVPDARTRRYQLENELPLSFQNNNGEVILSNLVRHTTNFSGRTLQAFYREARNLLLYLENFYKNSDLCKNIYNLENCDINDKNEPISTEILKQLVVIIKNTCEKERILLGSKPLSEYLPLSTGRRNNNEDTLTNNNNEETLHLLTKLLYENPHATGRIFIPLGPTLNKESAKIQIHTYNSNNDSKNSIEEIGIFNKNERLGDAPSMDFIFGKVLQVLVTMGVDTVNCNYIDLINMEYFYNNGAYNATDQVKLLDDVILKTKENPKSMVIFDLVSIVQETGETVQVKDLGKDRLELLHRIFDVMSTVAKNDQSDAKLVICVSSSESITDYFKERLFWPKTDEEEDDDKEYKCYYCGVMFTENENTDDACNYHASPYNDKIEFFTKRTKGRKETDPDTGERVEVKDKIRLCDRFLSTEPYSEWINVLTKAINDKTLIKDHEELLNAKYTCCFKGFRDNGKVNNEKKNFSFYVNIY